MLNDNRLYNPKKNIELLERILKLEKKLKDTSLSEEEIKSLNQRYISLLNTSQTELRKPANPKLMSVEEKRYFREPFLSYVGELTTEWQKLSDFRHKKERKTKKRKKKIPFELPVGIDEDIARLFRLLKLDSFKHYRHMQYLAHLEFDDEKEESERRLRCEIELFSRYLISTFISLRFDLLDIPQEQSNELIQSNLNKKEIQIDYFEKSKFLLDKIIKNSLRLKNQNLPEEQRTLISKTRERTRENLKTLENVFMSKAIESGIDLLEDFDNFQVRKDLLIEVINQYREHLVQIRDSKGLRSLDWRNVE